MAAARDFIVLSMLSSSDEAFTKVVAEGLIHWYLKASYTRS